MRHSRRTTLSADDVDSALSLRNLEVHYLFFAREYVALGSFFFLCAQVYPLVWC